MPLVDDLVARERIMQALRVRLATGVESLTREEISAFRVEGATPVRLIDQSRGIWNPREFEATLSILSSPDGPYGDAEIAPGVWVYHYRAGSSDGDNRKLRRAYELQVPLIMWRKITTGVYVPVFPVFVTQDDPNGRLFTITLDEIRYLGDPGAFTPDVRRYAEQIVKRRLHQPEFRGRVLHAYERHCTVCRLDRPQLLDAAHIVPDSQETGHALVTNGLALCKIHHAAYDANILGIDLTQWFTSSPRCWSHRTARCWNTASRTCTISDSCGHRGGQVTGPIATGWLCGMRSSVSPREGRPSSTRH